NHECDFCRRDDSWQTLETQNPLGRKVREGSTPSSGTDLKRQFHPHGRSFAVTGALELQRSTVSFGDKTRDIETDPHPCERRGAPGPTDERLPELGQIGSGDA